MNQSDVRKMGFALARRAVLSRTLFSRKAPTVIIVVIIAVIMTVNIIVIIIVIIKIVVSHGCLHGVLRGRGGYC